MSDQASSPFDERHSLDLFSDPIRRLIERMRAWVEPSAELLPSHGGLADALPLLINPLPLVSAS
ncbi:MAG: hypothetical protein OXB99_16120 [Acidimicrobiaceae bacterium]|nr:hypothetical protein [Acidimicrobiaceae bacterium]